MTVNLERFKVDVTRVLRGDGMWHNVLSEYDLWHRGLDENKSYMEYLLDGLPISEDGQQLLFRDNVDDIMAVATSLYNKLVGLYQLSVSYDEAENDTKHDVAELIRFKRAAVKCACAISISHIGTAETNLDLITRPEQRELVNKTIETEMFEGFRDLVESTLKNPDPDSRRKILKVPRTVRGRPGGADKSYGKDSNSGINGFSVRGKPAFGPPASSPVLPSSQYGKGGPSIPQRRRRTQ